MADRTVEDRLREEYFNLLSEIRRVVEYLDVQIRHRLLAVRGALEKFEQIEVRSRVKECESAIESLRVRQEGSVFYADRLDSYTLTSLKDLAGVRVLAFPRRRLVEIDAVLREGFAGWTADPISGDGGDGLKYWGFCAEVGRRIRGEYQIVSMLTGLFWEVEHSAIYKPTPRLKDIAESLRMRERSAAVLTVLRDFEEEFERSVGLDGKTQ